MTARAVYADPVPEALLCPLCKQALYEATLCASCNHCFCRPCVTPLPAVCPVPGCGSRTAPTLVRADAAAEQALNALTVHCPHREAGCFWTRPRDKLDAHLDKTCKHSSRPCRWGCGHEAKGTALRAHEQSCARAPAPEAKPAPQDVKALDLPPSKVPDKPADLTPGRRALGGSRGQLPMLSDRRASSGFVEAAFPVRGASSRGGSRNSLKSTSPTPSDDRTHEELATVLAVVGELDALVAERTAVWVRERAALQRDAHGARARVTALEGSLADALAELAKLRRSEQELQQLNQRLLREERGLRQAAADAERLLAVEQAARRDAEAQLAQARHQARHQDDTARKREQEAAEHKAKEEAARKREQEAAEQKAKHEAAERRREREAARKREQEAAEHKAKEEASRKADQEAAEQKAKEEAARKAEQEAAEHNKAKEEVAARNAAARRLSAADKDDAGMVAQRLGQLREIAESAKSTAEPELPAKRAAKKKGGADKASGAAAAAATAPPGPHISDGCLRVLLLMITEKLKGDSDLKSDMPLTTVPQPRLALLVRSGVLLGKAVARFNPGTFDPLCLRSKGGESSWNLNLEQVWSACPALGRELRDALVAGSVQAAWQALRLVVLAGLEPKARAQCKQWLGPSADAWPLLSVLYAWVARHYGPDQQQQQQQQLEQAADVPAPDTEQLRTVLAHSGVAPELLQDAQPDDGPLVETLLLWAVTSAIQKSKARGSVIRLGSDTSWIAKGDAAKKK